MSTEKEGNQDKGSAETVVADTLDADLNKAFDASEKAADAGTTTEATKADGKVDVSEAARTLAAQRKAAGSADAGDSKTVADDPAAKRAAELAAMAPEARAAAEAEDKKKAEEAAEVVEAPTHWPAADREMFGKQPKDVQKFLLARHKAMEADYTRKTQELGGVRRLKETLDEVFAPFREQMQLQGIDDATAIKQLVAAHAFLQRDPAAALKHLAQQYGQDLKALVEGGAAADPAGESPTVKALRAQLSELTTWKSQFTAQQGTEQLNARLNEVTQFAEEKDAQGQLKHPYFDEVAKDVAGLIHAARANKEQLSLQDAYDRAMYANPTTRAKVLAATDAQRRAKEETERKAKADAAKKAGFDVKGEGAATTVAAQHDDIEASLNAAFDASAGRV